MGSGHSYEKEFRDSQEMMERMRREADAAEERTRVQQEEMDKLRAERNRIQQEKDEIQAEKNKVQKEKNKTLAQKNRVQKEKRDALAENLRIQAEAQQKDLERVKKEKEQLEEYHRVQAINRELEERLRRVDEEKKMAAFAKKIKEESEKRVMDADYLREKAERNLKDGIPPVKYPTAEEITATRDRLQYQEGNVHLAITGGAGSGKSSLVNAFRGVSKPNKENDSNTNEDNDPNIARTGTSETTRSTERYCDPVRPWLIWYDVPGAGTPKVPSWLYFNNQGLYIFDAIIIVIDSRFTKIDLDILFDCKRFDIPAFVVRSKADQHIRNIMEEEDDDSDDSDEERFTRAQSKFIGDTYKEFEILLESAGLPQQDVYIISRKVLLGLVKGDKKIREKIIDEVDLIDEVTREVEKKHSEDLPQQAQPDSL